MVGNMGHVEKANYATLGRGNISLLDVHISRIARVSSLFYTGAVRL